ncbi:MAG: TIR domain-containing protein [candidate division KSB1 bacterium]|nr:TIR domain-containing protein [candidate division KSB1 bacterium]MDZ7340061.1 TIR domain-containing protein [candidate division KSB1 bacterium]
MPRVFISHSWNDNNIARKIAEYIKRDGAEIWIDYARIEGGDKLPKIISDALKRCDVLLLIWSRAANESYWVEEEWTNAHALRKKIIPCLLDNTELPAILANRLYIDFTNFNQGYHELCRALKLKTTKPSPTIPIFRSIPKELSPTDVKALLQKYDFYCKESYWNKEFCNPNGRGFANQFELQTIRGDKVVIDHASGLMWQQGGSAECMTYENAKKWIADLNQKGYAGYNDWRLPTLEEAMSLMEPKELNGDLYIDPKFDATQKWIWTSDWLLGESRAAWVVLFFNGGCHWNSFDYNTFVRAVRSGQSSIE